MSKTCSFIQSWHEKYSCRMNRAGRKYVPARNSNSDGTAYLLISHDLSHSLQPASYSAAILAGSPLPIIIACVSVLSKATPSPSMMESKT